MQHSQQSFFVFAIFLVGFGTAQGPDYAEEIGTTSTGKTFLLTKDLTADWLVAQYYTLIYSTGNYSYSLAAIESHEETQLIDDYFRNIYGNNSMLEEIWIGGTSLGTAKPYENSYVKWTSSDVPISESSYSNFYPRIYLSPANLLSWRVCVTGQYVTFNFVPTFYWRYTDCRLPLRFLIQRFPLA